ncbi:IDEAL domain-containing protein [Bacillus sp. ISL-47]|uniref:IDEAL domain-containing protein n=1 Tax=Bacillus sp. ISL-47 TaxID=2819130 RepID=UPI001BE9C280|nr:IDEAL domain-containing protein [Bacillus sp. ISL-47]MBT2686693.1 IDEAL domain-containing protein [Bacillus sp. ISL-47]MBT2707087.1 IDEAL domain-containing protein [Pseudomonas sp. ISL-84]
MMSRDNSILKTGDWIKGKSPDGELIIGYIERIDILEETVKTKVISSDNKTIEGKIIPMLSKQVKKMPVSKVANKEQVHYLIDLALASGDEEWFFELTFKLNKMRELVNAAK